MKRTVFATDPFTGEGGIDCPEEIAVGDFSRRDWPFRAHGCDKKAVNYIQVGSNACIDVNLMNEDKLFLKFVKLSTHLSADEKKRGMNMQAKKMSLILESLQDPEDRVEIPIQVVCEPRPEPVRKRKLQNNTRQTTIKTEPMAAIEEMEPVVKLPNVEVIPNMVGLTKEEKIQMIADHLHAAPSQLTDAIFFILRQAPVVSFEGNFQTN